MESNSMSKSQSQSQSKSLVNAVSLTVARQNLFELVENVAVTGQPVTLTEHGQPKVALIAIDDFEAWLETRFCLPLPKSQRSAGSPVSSRRQAMKEPNLTSRYERLANSLEQAGFLLSERPTTWYTTDAPRSPRATKRRRGR